MSRLRPPRSGVLLCPDHERGEFEFRQARIARSVFEVSPPEAHAHGLPPIGVRFNGGDGYVVPFWEPGGYVRLNSGPGGFYCALFWAASEPSHVAGALERAVFARFAHARRERVVFVAPGWLNLAGAPRPGVVFVSSESGDSPATPRVGRDLHGERAGRPSAGTGPERQYY